MKATTQHTLFCECNHAMSYVASAAGPLTVLQCANVRCQHYGKRFDAPAFELVEIPPPAPAVVEAEVVEIGDGDVMAGEIAEAVAEQAERGEQP